MLPGLSSAAGFSYCPPRLNDGCDEDVLCQVPICTIGKGLRWCSFQSVLLQYSTNHINAHSPLVRVDCYKGVWLTQWVMLPEATMSTEDEITIDERGSRSCNRPQVGSRRLCQDLPTQECQDFLRHFKRFLRISYANLHPWRGTLCYNRDDFSIKDSLCNIDGWGGGECCRLCTREAAVGYFWKHTAI